MEYPDVFFTEEYQDLFKDTAFGGEPAHFNAEGIDYRFYVRPIPECHLEDYGCCDIVSPYGYSGPVAVKPSANWGSFHSQFGDYCLDNGIIAEFARLHPFIENHQHLIVQPEHDIVYIDLTQDDIRRGFNLGCKSKINKAKAAGITIVEANWVTAGFRELYSETMKRDNASQSYLFNNSFFDNLIKLKVRTISAVYQDMVIASALILCQDDYAHYFLSGSTPNNLGATNLLIYDTALKLKQEGYKIFNLGGGLKAGDSLESFKKSFSKTTKPFYTYRKIHNWIVYSALCRKRGVDPNSEGYFPSYRRLA